MYQISYKEEVLYSDLTIEQCSEILQSLSEEFYESDEFDPTKIEIIHTENT